MNEIQQSPCNVTHLLFICMYICTFSLELSWPHPSAWCTGNMRRSCQRSAAHRYQGPRHSGWSGDPWSHLPACACIPEHNKNSYSLLLDKCRPLKSTCLLRPLIYRLIKTALQRPHVIPRWWTVPTQVNLWIMNASLYGKELKSNKVVKENGK
jgi:hypothetical protein